MRQRNGCPKCWDSPRFSLSYCRIARQTFHQPMCCNCSKLPPQPPPPQPMCWITSTKDGQLLPSMAMRFYDFFVGEKDNKFHPTKLDDLIPTTTRVVMIFRVFSLASTWLGLLGASLVRVRVGGAKVQVHWFSHSFTVLYCSDWLGKMIPTGYCLFRWIVRLLVNSPLDMVLQIPTVIIVPC